MNPDARYLIEKRVAEMEKVQRKMWRTAEEARVFAMRGLLRGILNVWSLWHDFSASKWV